MATDILMPALSPTMTEGKLARWLKAEGDTVSAGDVIAEIETDKATMEVEAVDEGILGRILIKEGVEGVPVNTPIAVLVEEGEAVPDASSMQAPAAPKAEVAPPETMRAVPAKASAEEKGERIFVSPLARRMARERGIALDELTGSGPNGRILKRDVEKGVTAPKTEPKVVPAATLLATSEDTVRRVPNSTMRKVIARRLTESKTQVPHFYVSVDIELDALLELRSKLNATAQENSFKISVNDMMIKAVALALKKVPGVNVQFTDVETLHFENVDISMAVSVPDGLITPIIRNADHKSLRQISVEAKDLAKRARSGKLKPEEFQGGTFSISNMGMFGVREFAAIINPPQAGILAIASGEKRAVVRGSEIAVATVMTATLSVDHRAVDGALGAEWLNALRDIVQNPYILVV
ncbi:pyruvate dehydrogenase complex dihydrolipoamide acetyltransferase [Gluconobacter sphaericus]|uniref:Acetyltransferase component of pyruvate dehydrogenase complex n=1 Tax=Gluconobacter sphaericus NBRC 12467 TaxID=1307951 RepID=A0AA37WAE2_9PROT|nr:pyruvate dehydrogenase complex dihydrolipoamide acetyltransferase [Gluconobacter sphaericus]MBF0885442.1 pyruvate dehydrogenase complex dihydrolipoamide acetyltransferase [Gluconobacter sphaericus]GBR56307.1 dihydrolipoamide acetyltransferase component [Gluconobacter sphaericus NBRC 12467]GEB42677.1 acetyltransferase component of pyruvate dehydrogenase complex [Gluconobacter sphaericus NBRC 12467]GLQ84653.1 acetyltransferase component of pyruvate dehydrogenase complex [Gluconobacter sphaeric